jgi:hypothetical protein
MKKFVSENWYKLMIGSSLLMASFGFMVHSVSPAMADDNNQKFNVNSNYRLVQTNADGSINVKLSDEQINSIKAPTGIQEVQIVGYDKNGTFGKARVGKGQLIVFNNSNPVNPY